MRARNYQGLVNFVLPSAVIEVREYVDPRGRRPFALWFLKQDDAVQARITFALERVELGSVSAKGVGGGVLELRLFFGPGYRVYFGRDGDALVILLGGGTKNRQQADIEEAQQLWREYKQRKRQR